LSSPSRAIIYFWVVLVHLFALRNGSSVVDDRSSFQIFTHYVQRRNYRAPLIGLIHFVQSVKIMDFFCEMNYESFRSLDTPNLLRRSIRRHRWLYGERAGILYARTMVRCSVFCAPGCCIIFDSRGHVGRYQIEAGFHVDDVGAVWTATSIDFLSVLRDLSLSL
jgi:hypothetical protein